MHYEPLSQALQEHIQKEGPLNIAAFTNTVLAHPQHGYYMRQDPFGTVGDFTTAPEVSQIFGELIAGWIMDIWHKMDKPKAFTLLECGPGRGTLMADILRTCRVMPDIVTALHPVLLELSPVLTRLQHQALRPFTAPGKARQWIETLDALPEDKPVIVIGNEFLDALPVHQLRAANGQWQERAVSYQDGGFCDTYVPAPAERVKQAEPFVTKEQEAVCVEISPARHDFMADLLIHMNRHGGAGLFIDYGHEQHQPGESLQAVHHHRPCPVLEHIGHADLSSHVDFGSLMKQVRAHDGNRFCALAAQGDFLGALGGVQRTEKLVSAAGNPQAKKDMIMAYHRLTHNSQMGALFKVMGFVQGYNINDVAGF